MDFSCEVLKDENELLKIKLVGLLNEHAELPLDLNLDGKKELRIDMGRLDFINSAGIKKWLGFVERIEERAELKILFYRLPRIFINQMNIIKGFFPSNGEVMSVYIPVYCEECSSSFNILNNINESKALPSEADVLKAFDSSQCPQKNECKQTYEVDVDLTTYLPFLTKK